MPIEISYDKSTENTVKIKIHNETHTLGSSLSEKLTKDPRCLFSAYSVLHPKDDFMYLRVGCDKTISVKDCIVENLVELENMTQDIINQIK
ncbi:DNA-directed RNA polymerases I and III subunit [Vairimorpha necatrix]|uniref:DNA-directed RNA polymerases I and III subunit n=1 Tax=Vairimorpha necatrix TaxID=6039 RepID=A0AAX4JFB6_9MICR